MGCQCNRLRLLYLGEAQDIQQKATSDRLMSPSGDIELIMRAHYNNKYCNNILIK
jgi:hypothetical protein